MICKNLAVIGAVLVCLSAQLTSCHPIEQQQQQQQQQQFGFLEDIENEIIKDTIKSTVKTLIENTQEALNSGKDFDEVFQKLEGELKSFGKVALWAVKEYIKWNKETISGALGDELSKLIDKLLDAVDEEKTFGWLEDIENEVIKETLKSTIKGLIDSAEDAFKSGGNLDEIVAKLAKEFKAFGKVALWAVQTYLKYNKESISAQLGDELTALVDRLLSEAESY